MEAQRLYRWDTWVFHRSDAVTVKAYGPERQASAIVNADYCNYWSTEDIGRKYGIDLLPEGAKILRISRVVSRPRHVGGGTAVMEAYCNFADKENYWTVLEVCPYPGQDLGELIRFYLKYGFRGSDELMYRPPGADRVVFP